MLFNKTLSLSSDSGRLPTAIDIPDLCLEVMTWHKMASHSNPDDTVPVFGGNVDRVPVPIMYTEPL
jgi:hypothetical protein